MIFEVMAHAGEIDCDVDTVAFEFLSTANARQHQKLWRVDRTSAQNNLTCRLPVKRSSVSKGDRHGAPVDDFNLLNQRMKQKPQILSAQVRLQKSIGGATTKSPVLRKLSIGHAVLGVAVIVRVERIPYRASGFNKRLANGMRPLDRSNVKGTALSSQGAALVAGFQVAKDWHDLIGRPSPHTAAKR